MEKVKQAQVNRQIKGEIYDSLRKALVQPTGKTKESWTDSFIKVMLKEAKTNPNGELGKIIAKQLLQDDIISSLDEQTEKLLARDYDFIRYRILKTCFKPQRDVLLDTFIQRKILMTSRRAGKTNVDARILVDACVEPDTPCLYIHTKFENAIRQCFNLCIEVAKEAELPIARESANEGIIEFVNGSTIIFKGNANRAEAEKFRGGKYKVIIVDEAAFQCNMKYLIEDICTPMLADFKPSYLILSSTPPRVPHTYYEDCLNRPKEWKQYNWTAVDNPFIPDFDEFINDMCEKKGLTRESPFIQREFLGKLVYDREAMLFKGYQTYKSIPDDFNPTHCAIGCDFGFSDYNSLVSLIFNCNSGEGYILPITKKFNKATVTAIVDTARSVYGRSLDKCLELNKDIELNHIYLYTDTSDQSIAYEMSQKYGLPVANCYKHNKQLALAELADWLRTGKIKVWEGDEVLIDEFERTVYKRDEQDNILPEIDDDTFHPDAVDALLYASREYAWSCGLDSGGQSSDKKNKDTRSEGLASRTSTLPDWLNNLGEDE